MHNACVKVTSSGIDESKRARIQPMVGDASSLKTIKNVPKLIDKIDDNETTMPMKQHALVDLLHRP